MIGKRRWRSWVADFIEVGDDDVLMVARKKTEWAGGDAIELYSLGFLELDLMVLSELLETISLLVKGFSNHQKCSLSSNY